MLSACYHHFASATLAQEAVLIALPKEKPFQAGTFQRKQKLLLEHDQLEIL